MVFVSKISLPAKLENLEQMLQFVSAVAKKCGFTQQRIQELELATEEALVNVIKYAYPEEAGPVEMRCDVVDDRVKIEIMDAGIPFNPLSQGEPNLTASISDRKVGGLGIYFIRQMMDEVEYRREKGKNILSFIPPRE